jgi:hypothetical protein
MMTTTIPMAWLQAVDNEHTVLHSWNWLDEQLQMLACAAGVGQKLKRKQLQ